MSSPWETKFKLPKLTKDKQDKMKKRLLESPLSLSEDTFVGIEYPDDVPQIRANKEKTPARISFQCAPAYC